MKVILLDNIKGVGKKDEVINASDGYARNFLFQRKLAVEANAENMSKLKNKQDSVQHKKNVEKEKAEDIAKKLERHYNKKIVITNEQLNTEIFNANFDDEPIEKILSYFMTLRR